MRGQSKKPPRKTTVPGVAMPGSCIMLEVCDILSIGVNELLSGERISMENSHEKNRQQLLDMTREVERKNRLIWTSMWVLMGVSLTALLGGLLVCVLLIPEGIWQLAAILACCILFLLPCFYALKLEISVGAYKCKDCGCEVVPTYSEALWAMHMGTTRRLKCPKCGKRTWCKKVLNK